MIILISVLVIAYLIASFVHFKALKKAFKEKGIWGALMMSIAILIHQISSIITG